MPWTRFSCRDHPRIRGEHTPEVCDGQECEGSSPHTRGALECRTEAIDNSRIIPAYAGSTRRSPARRIRLPDHPRIRGEHVGGFLCVGVHLGSSPHTRGAQKLGDAVGCARGIIPAYAGSTRTAAWRSRRAGDHPRIRGEHDPNRSFGEKMAGSSPHTRGAPATKSELKGIDRIIPAYAGSTAARRCFSLCSRDHPRIRGEHSCSSAGVR